MNGGEIMKVNTLAPTPGNFLDIVELTKTLKDKNNLTLVLPLF
ncbi:MAG: hypothetical protein WKF59_11165 [Chitinophagaceae bacterium]